MPHWPWDREVLTATMADGAAAERRRRLFPTLRL